MKTGSYRESVRNRFGKKGFTKKDTIRMSVINKDIHSRNEKLKKKAQFAKNFRKKK